MSGGHTPGPWTVPHFAIPDDVCECDCRSVLSESQVGAGAIATVHYQGEPGDARRRDNEPLETAKANAHLIASAPLLLDALEHCESTLERLSEASLGRHSVTGHPYRDELLHNVRAVIAKARGQE